MKKLRSSVFALLLSLSFLLAGCGAANPEAVETAPVEAAEPKLNISLVSGPSTETTSFTEEDLNGNFAYGLTYHRVTDVTIELGGTVLNLEEAFQTGALTEEEVFAFTRLDAKQGFCTEEFKSRNGLTHFTYRYPDYNLRLIYDVYETPDGQQHLISNMAIYPPSGMILGEYVDFVNEETGQRLDREDWGLTLEVTQVSCTGITVNCSQSGGQQIGTLHVTDYVLINTNTSSFAECLNGSAEIPAFDFAFQMEGSTQMQLDWVDIYGELPSGDYEVWLYVNDIFDESQVHPLMQDYHDMQIYPVAFSIP